MWPNTRRYRSRPCPRVINNEIPVREETRARVMRSINELGYVANITAQRLARGRSHAIGFVYFNASWHYTNLVMRGVLAAGKQSGYSTLLHPLESCQSDACDSILRMAIQGSVDGFYIYPSLRQRSKPAERTGCPGASPSYVSLPKTTGIPGLT